MQREETARRYVTGATTDFVYFSLKIILQGSNYLIIFKAGKSCFSFQY